MSLLPSNFLKSTVLIRNGNNFGTGFFVGINTGKKDEEKKEDLYSTFLVTNKHVINKFSNHVSLDVNSNKGIVKIPLLKRENWSVHPEFDIAICPVSSHFLSQIKAEVYFIKQEKTIDNKADFFKKIHVGQEVYMLGYPLGIGMEEENKRYPIARQGIIARNDEHLLDQGKLYLDINNFPGNSGGPIFIKPSSDHLVGRDPVKASLLIALVSAFIPFRKTLHDNTVDPPMAKMIIEENSGIAIAMPIYLVIDLAKEWIGKNTQADVAEIPSREKGDK